MPPAIENNPPLQWEVISIKFRIEFIGEDEQEEIVVRCRKIDENVQRLVDAIEQSEVPQAIVYTRRDQEYYFPPTDILFFETDGDKVHAHTEKETYEVSERLYQLEEMLPREFMRISKSTIANTAKILSLSRTVMSSMPVEFNNTPKKVHVSRMYYKALKDRLTNRR